MTRRFACTLFLVSLVVGVVVTSAYATEITVNSPTRTGTVTLQACDTFKVYRNNSGNKVMECSGPQTKPVPVTRQEDPNIKAGDIATALGKLTNVGKASAAANVITVTPGTFVYIRVSDIGSGESTKISQLANGDPPGMPFVATIGYSGTPGGGTYQASLGDTSFTAMASLTLGPVSLSTLVSDMFYALQSDLPSSLQPDLFLDQTNNLIGFEYPSTSVDPFAQNFTSDPTAASIVGIGEATPVTLPEPSCLTLLALGIAGMASRLRLKSARGARKPIH